MTAEMSKTLFPMRARCGDPKGTVIMLPGAGDSITSFIELAEIFSEAFELFGLQPRGFESGEEPYPSIEYAVNVYSEIILSSQPVPPYFFVGHSFGGYVALELAKKLLKRGTTVGPLVLLDVSPPKKSHQVMSRTECLLTLVEILEMRSDKKFDLTVDEFSSMSEASQIDLLRDNMIRTGIVPQLSSKSSIESMANVFIANVNSEYVPASQYDGAGLLVKARDCKQALDERRDDFTGWLSFIPKLKYAESAGNHVTLLSQQNSVELVDCMERFWRSNVRDALGQKSRSFKCNALS